MIGRVLQVSRGRCFGEIEGANRQRYYFSATWLEADERSRELAVGELVTFEPTRRHLSRDYPDHPCAVRIRRADIFDRLGAWLTGERIPTPAPVVTENPIRERMRAR